MTRRRPARALGGALGLAVAVSLILGLAAGTARADLGTSPGPISRAHAAIEAQCNRCHVPFGGVPQRQCLACHTALAERTARGLGFHATVKAQPCTDCHKEHHGRDAQLAPAPPANFDHRITGFPLEADHARLACDRCHAAAGGAQRWVGLQTTCQSCHADRVHHGALGSDCARCHRASGWTPTLYTAKDHQTSLAGGHAKLQCADCHRAGAHLTGPEPCVSCHAQPHGGTQAPCETCHHVTTWKQVTFGGHRFTPAQLPGKHQTATCLACHPAFQFSRTALDCASCHDKVRPHEPLGACEACHSALAWKLVRFDHDRPGVGFALTGQHQRVDCTSCHKQGKFNRAGRTCAQCHGDPHDRQFDIARPFGPTRLATELAANPPANLPADSVFRRAFAPLSAITLARACSDCHTTAGWRPSTIKVANHRKFAFPLRDAHARASCRSCHKAGVFVGTTHACAGCHPDVRHRGRFGTDCASCHDAVAWSRTPTFDHGRTGFALDNAHAQVACKACHGDDGLRLTGVAQPTACQTCHTAPHGKQFGERCTECHNTQSFQSIPPFDHAARTDFPLELRHQTLRCLQCHDARQRPTVNRACRTCHGDPHRGSNSFDCGDCHRADRWRVIRFDHDLTSYPLVGHHRIASCGGCHTNPNWTGVRTDCVACHAFDRPRTQDHLTKIICDDCHSPTSWRTIHR
ncbi:MAG TPA: cytochrome c3 family protein [Kofleriaceae bacterium]|jgi:hypothetical protein|nr:cytochrome c3 family protein [Kofleriaceae bacterium]